MTPGERLPIPDTLGALVEARIGALPPATRAALLLAAVAAEPTIDTLRRADPEAPAALDAGRSRPASSPIDRRVDPVHAIRSSPRP